MHVIDEHIADIVAALAALPAVTTSASCGGHEDPQPGQVPADEFYVECHVEQSGEGWRSLERITRSCSWARECGLRLDLEAWYDGGFGSVFGASRSTRTALSLPR